MYCNVVSGLAEIFPAIKNENIKINVRTNRFAKTLPFRMKLDTLKAIIESATAMDAARNGLDTLWLNFGARKKIGGVQEKGGYEVRRIYPEYVRPIEWNGLGLECRARIDQGNIGRAYGQHTVVPNGTIGSTKVSHLVVTKEPSFLSSEAPKNEDPIPLIVDIETSNSYSHDRFVWLDNAGTSSWCPLV